ncbi:MAG TPA: isopentenyl-diphosphate Delta-isomerase [Flavisolibacter sp.]|nr:isopentenyl-diphosphate Delta-isomerase [Flavisolibacter sp.]
MQEVILVTEKDEEIGTMEKMEAHRRGVLHRAFSIFIFDERGNMLLQKRANGKYHGGGLWSNACCSHPLPHESIEQAADRRLLEELGFETPIQKAFSFTYRAPVENDLIEHEFDHVFFGTHGGKMDPNKDEVEAVTYLSMEDLETKIQEQPAKFTKWFCIVFPQVKEWFSHSYSKQINKSV